MDLLLGSRNARADRKNFLKAQLLYWVLAAPDGHAKNFSVFLEPHGRFSLAPLYDVLSAYPILGHGKNRLSPRKLTMAMSVIGTRRYSQWEQATTSRWRSTALKCRAQGEMESIFQEIIESAPGAVDRVSSMLPPGFPSEVSGPIFDGVQAAVERLRRGIELAGA